MSRRSCVGELQGLRRRVAVLGVMGGILSTVVVSSAMAQGAQGPAGKPIVFDGVTVIDVEHGTRVPDQRVVIEKNRISAIGKGSAVKIPAGAQVVDAHGKYLIPGLWDTHTHSRRATDVFYPLFIANGVTAIRDAGSEVPLDTLQLWRREIVAGTRVGPPRQLLSGQSIAGPEAGCVRSQMSDSPQTCVSDAADAVHYVDSLHAAGADMIKPRSVDAEIYYAVAAESRKLHIPFGGHAEQELAIDVSDSGATIVDHMQHRMGELGIQGQCWVAESSASADKCRVIADRFKRNHTWFVPTLVRDAEAGGFDAGSGVGSSAMFAFFKKRVAEFWGGSLLHGNWLHDSSSVGAAVWAAAPKGNMRLMHEVGLPIMAGTDAGSPVLKTMPPGFALQVELAAYGAEGMTPLEVLQSATINPAKMWRATDSLGTVATGKLADVVLLDADPLADITNTTAIRAVVANGRYYDRAALDALLTEVQAKSR